MVLCVCVRACVRVWSGRVLVLSWGLPKLGVCMGGGGQTVPWVRGGLACFMEGQGEG